MKKTDIILVIALLLISTLKVRSQELAPFNSENWVIEDPNSQVQEIKMTTLYGKSCLHLPAGHVAYFNDSSYMNFRLEMDIAGIVMPGFGFRGTDKRNYEHLYLRVLSDNQGDALQYLPTFNGGLSWQLYNYPNYEQRATFPKRYLGSVDGRLNVEMPAEELNEHLKKFLNLGGVASSDAAFMMQTGPASWKIIDPENLSLHYVDQADDSLKIYNGLEWIHVKLEVFEKKALFYMEDMETPAMEIACLKQEEAPGLIILKNVSLDSYYADIRIERIDSLPGFREAEAGEAPVAYLSEWELSGKFRRDDQILQEQIDSVKSHTDQWSSIKSDPDGLMNLSRYFEETEGSAILRTYIESPVDEQVDLLFDYSEHLAISLNSDIIFSDSVRMRENQGRVMDGEEKIQLELNKGTNELLFILTSDAYRQNWGMIAKIGSLP